MTLSSSLKDKNGGRRVPVQIVCLLVVLLFILLEANWSQISAQEASAGEESYPGFDSATGIWYPPHVKPEVYISGNNQSRSYSGDLIQALKQDPAFATKLCKYAMNNSPELGEKVSPRIRQLKTMFDMACVSFMVQKSEAKKEKRRTNALESELFALFDWENVQRMGREERWHEADALEMRILTMPDCADGFKGAMRDIALRPESDVGIFLSLQYAGCGSTDKYQLNEGVLENFLQNVYEENASKNDTEAWRWKQGLRSLCYLTGDFQKARDLSKEILAFPAMIDRPQYEIVFLGILERILGNPDPLSQVLSDCPKAALSRLAEETGATTNCLDLTQWIASRGIMILGKKAPWDLRDILIEVMASQPDAWDNRVEIVQKIAAIDPERANEEFEKILELPDSVIPESARMRALYELSNLADKWGHFNRAIELIDEYLNLFQMGLPTFTDEVWKRIAALPDSPPAKSWVSASFNTKVLEKRFGYSISARNFREAEHTLEMYALYQIERGYAGRIRAMLADLARAEFHAGLEKQAIQVLGFLVSQPHDGWPEMIINEISKQLALPEDDLVSFEPKNIPWDTVKP